MQNNRIFPRTSSPRKRRGFTLMEIIIVIALIALIVGAGFSNLGGIFSDNQKKIAETDIQALETPLFAYQVKHGAYPTTEEGLQAVVNSGELKKLPEETRTVADLANLLKVKPQGTALAVNGALVMKSNWGTHKLQPHDNVMNITAAYGG